MILLADCGNSQLKLALADDRGPAPASTPGEAPADLDRWLARREPERLALVAGNQERAARLRAWWAGRGPLATAGDDLPLPDLGQYPGCGADRVLAGLALANHEPAGAIVVDAGTAVTLGAWRPVRSGLRFAGGLILPGRWACALGLATAAPALPLVAGDTDEAWAPAHATEAAIAQGLAIGHPAMVAACLAHLRAATGLATVVVTGGGAAGLGAAVVCGARARPGLVLEGLWLLTT